MNIFAIIDIIGDGSFTYASHLLPSNISRPPLWALSPAELSIAIRCVSHIRELDTATTLGQTLPELQ